MKQSLRKCVPSKHPIFQHDNDLKYTSKLCKKYLVNQNINTLDWPSQSSDMNPMEHAHKILDDNIRDRKCKNENESFELVKNEWKNMDKKYLRNLIKSMPRRIKAVVEAKGGHTKY